MLRWAWKSRAPNGALRYVARHKNAPTTVLAFDRDGQNVRRAS